jgi:hydroxymethylbilane synthase
MTTYKIGTRGSLLAVTQSTLVKNQLEKISGKKFELVLIKTQGDQITDRPLWQLEGKDFFTKELDEALLKGEVDLVIHSYKDLGSERPDGIKLAAVTERRFAHDILLIRKDVIRDLANWKGEFVVGTSSPRRIVNLTRSLAPFIPYSTQTNLNIHCETLRGNVNTRIGKLKNKQYHAITLALAGIERLAHTEESAVELQELLNDLNYFVLPQSVFPAAASQGALGIEMREGRADDGELFSYISQLAHPVTVEEVYRERKAFKEFGGGCHLAVGIHVKKIGENFLHVHAGEVDKKLVQKKWLEGTELPKISKKKLFVGLPQGEGDFVFDKYQIKSPIKKAIDLNHKHVFITSRYCIDMLETSTDEAKGIWAAGTRTAKKLAEAGYWVNGTSDSLGTDDLKALKNSKALAMFNAISEPWVVLSHKNATSDIGVVTEAYERKEAEVSEDWIQNLKEVGACYWTSFPQYEAYLAKFSFLREAKHFCGLGKTWQEFSRAGIPVTPVASMQDFYSLIKE